MNLQFYFEKLLDSEEFRKFKDENPEAYFCSGFIVLDREDVKNPKNQVHLDYCVPSPNKIFSFHLENSKIEEIPIDVIHENKVEKIADNVDFDFEEIENLVLGKMKEKGIDNKLQKILLSLQLIEGKESLAGTVFISSLGMIKIVIDISEMKIIDFEKKSFFDILRKK